MNRDLGPEAVSNEGDGGLVKGRDGGDSVTHTTPTDVPAKHKQLLHGADAMELSGKAAARLSPPVRTRRTCIKSQEKSVLSRL